MIKQPYETTPCKNYRLEPIIMEIKKAMINGELMTAKTPKGGELDDVYIVTAQNPAVPQFAHPLMVEMNGKSFWVFDGRGMTRISREGQLVTVSSTDYDLAVMRTLLSRHWLDNGESDLRSVGRLPAVVFTRWLSENIARRVVIDPQTQMRVTVICALYYFNQFTDEAEWSDVIKVKTLAQVAQQTRIPLDRVVEMGQDIPFMSNISDLVLVIKNHAGSMRFDTFNLGLLYSMFMGSWFGSNSREIVAVAMEHPPTFLALVYLALNERSYRKTALAQVVLASDKQDLGRTYTYNLLGLLNNGR